MTLGRCPLSIFCSRGTLSLSLESIRESLRVSIDGGGRKAEKDAERWKVYLATYGVTSGPPYVDHSQKGGQVLASLKYSSEKVEGRRPRAGW